MTAAWPDLALSLALGISLAACAGLRAWLPLLLAGGAARMGWHGAGSVLPVPHVRPRADPVRRGHGGRDGRRQGARASTTLLDVLSTVLRPAAGSLLAASVLWPVSDPLTALALGVAVGAPTALLPHAAKSMLRAASTALTAGLANPLISLLEDADRDRPVRAGRACAAAGALHRAAGRVLRRAKAPSARGSGGHGVRRRRAAPPRLALAALPRACCSASRLPARAHPAAAASLEVDVDVVSVTAVVHDKAGRFVPGLGPQDVEVLEDGVPPGGRLLPRGQARARTNDPALRGAGPRLLGSMVPQHALPAGGGHQLRSDKLEETDTAMVVQLQREREGQHGVHERRRPPGADRERPAALGRHQPLRRRPLLPGPRASDQPGRKAVVVFSDGADTTSTSFNEQEVVDYAKRGGSHHLRRRDPRRAGPVRPRAPRGSCASSRDETGGAFFFPDKIGELNRSSARSPNELKSHYLLLVLAPAVARRHRSAPSACAWCPPRRRTTRCGSARATSR